MFKYKEKNIYLQKIQSIGMRRTYAVPTNRKSGTGSRSTVSFPVGSGTQPRPLLTLVFFEPIEYA